MKKQLDGHSVNNKEIGAVKQKTVVYRLNQCIMRTQGQGYLPECWNCLGKIFDHHAETAEYIIAEPTDEHERMRNFLEDESKVSSAWPDRTVSCEWPQFLKPGTDCYSEYRQNYAEGLDLDGYSPGISYLHFPNSLALCDTLVLGCHRVRGPPLLSIWLLPGLPTGCAGYDTYLSRCHSPIVKPAAALTALTAAARVGRLPSHGPPHPAPPCSGSEGAIAQVSLLLLLRCVPVMNGRCRCWAGRCTGWWRA
eukprot:COSAG01_NODE_9550_length_2412_cov_2.242542_2_plen_251_part_00